MNWEAIRTGLARSGNERYWKGLEELSETPEFLDYLRHEFPRQADELNDTTGRRNFLKLMAASLGLAGVSLSGCMRQPDEKIVPYVRQPEDFVPGKPLYFATCTTLGGYATGVLVESHLGRPTKIEGNPEHPASLGATDALTQAMILSLYDPDRSQTLMKRGQIATWADFLTALAGELPALVAQKGTWAGRSYRDRHLANTGRAVAITVEGLAPSHLASIRARGQGQCARRSQTGVR